MSKRVGLVAFLVVSTVCATLGSLLIGAREMGFETAVSAVRDGIVLAFSDTAEQLEASSDEAKIIAQLRVPRTLLGLLVGAALGTAGALLQGHTRNPLADTNLLGVGPGAALAVAAAISFHGSMTVLGTVGVGFLGAMLAAALVEGDDLVGLDGVDDLGHDAGAGDERRTDGAADHQDIVELDLVAGLGGQFLDAQHVTGLNPVLLAARLEDCEHDVVFRLCRALWPRFPGVRRASRPQPRTAHPCGVVLK